MKLINDEIKHPEFVAIIKDELEKIKNIPVNKNTSEYGSLLTVLGYKDIKLNLNTNKAEINGFELNWARIRTDFRDLGYEKHLDAITDYILAQAYDNKYTPKGWETEDKL